MEKENDVLCIALDNLRGVGPKTAFAMKEKGLNTLEDLLYLVPTRYEDKRTIRAIGEIREGETAVVVARVINARPRFYRRSRRRSFEATVTDDTGSLTLKWFHSAIPYLKRVCTKGALLHLSGTVTRFEKSLQMVHPEIVPLKDRDNVGKLQDIIPIYPDLDGIKQGFLRAIIRQAIEAWGDRLVSILPTSMEHALGLSSLREVLWKIHVPDETMLDGDTRRIVLQRLILEEFLLFQMSLLSKREEMKTSKGIAFVTRGKLRRTFESSLSFRLTEAQMRVIGEIERNMGVPEPMNRLLQGDVGSGKTIVAVAASCIALDSGYQVVFMAPTEILAEQHYLTVHRLFEQLGVSVAYLRGQMGKERKAVINAIRSGQAKVIVGTHALLQDDVTFFRLGLIIVDEQHRFGVLQRSMLRHKGAQPDVIVMTATPIPRTLSMVIYGDLDVSVIDQMPAGRQSTVTKVVEGDKRHQAYELVLEELKKGGQAFIVYPLVEVSEKSEMLNATHMAEVLRREIFRNWRVDLLHGRMKAEEKETVMARFQQGQIDVLVCTTVIEVGIDVPNVSIIVIEHAERFGLSQLHQLRGRVGRGSRSAQCVLVVSGALTEIGRERIEVMERTSDGFEIAENDMRLRGPGEMFGTRQSGIPEFKLGNLLRDGEIMNEARKLSRQAFVLLSGKEKNLVRKRAIRRWGESIHLSDTA